MAKHKVIPRSAWNAPYHNFPALSNTLEGLFVHHTVGNAPGLRAKIRKAGVKFHLRAAERAEMRNLDAVAVSRGFIGISYSFIVFPSGRLYEGRGRGKEGAHTIGYNDTAYAVAAAGNYDVNRPSDRMIEAIRWLRRDYLLLANRPVRPHSAVYGTACPGQFLRARLSEL